VTALTTFRAAVQSGLQTALGIRFYAGIHEGPIEDRDLGCCWAAGKREYAQDVNLEEVFVTVRVFKQFKAKQGFTEYDEVPLENLIDALQDALKPLQTTLGPWMFRVIEITRLEGQYGVEAQLVALQPNRFAAGG
jgi:hypothetical protein